MPGSLPVCGFGFPLRALSRLYLLPGNHHASSSDHKSSGSDVRFSLEEVSDKCSPSSDSDLQFWISSLEEDNTLSRPIALTTIVTGPKLADGTWGFLHLCFSFLLVPLLPGWDLVGSGGSDGDGEAGEVVGAVKGLAGAAGTEGRDSGNWLPDLATSP